jgi:hypothetical protein
VFISGVLQKPLEEYIQRWNGLVKLYRTGKRVGLIEARTLGAQKSTGDVIIILDAHCECVRFHHISINMYTSTKVLLSSVYMSR